MGLFSKNKDSLPYKIKLVERIDYVAGSKEAQDDLRRLEQRRQEFIEEAKLQLVEESNKKIMMISKWGDLMTEDEKQMIIEKITQNPFLNIDKDIKIPYSNIRRAIRRAHAY